jgi:hypothetical protein
MLSITTKGVELLAISSSLPLSSGYSEFYKREYFISIEEQCTSDLGYHAAKRLISHLNVGVNDFGFLLFGSRTPDYRSPITAAVLQSRLALPIDCICFDVNVGANGFIQMIEIGVSLLNSINRTHGLIIIGDTPSKLKMGSSNQSFEISDAATAIILKKSDDSFSIEFKNISIGNDYDALLLRQGGFRCYNSEIPFDSTDINNFVVTKNDIKISDSIKTAFDYIFEKSNLNNENMLLHHNLIEWLGVDDKHESLRSVLADSSELPILLYSISEYFGESKNQFSFWSAGEGLSIFNMNINHFPICLDTENTDEYFLDYKVKHEI